MKASGVPDRFKKARQAIAALLFPAPPESESIRMNPLLSTSQSANVVLPAPGTPQRINTRGSCRMAETIKPLGVPCHVTGLVYRPSATGSVPTSEVRIQPSRYKLTSVSSGPFVVGGTKGFAFVW